MSGPGSISGGCQCGAVRYTVMLKRVVAYACHCLECQKQSASAFALSVPVPADRFHVAGEVNVYRRATDSGTSTNCFFCAACGTRVYHQSERSPAVVTIKGGTLDDGGELDPVAHLWASRKHGWIALPEGCEVYETQPENLKQWRDGLMAGLDGE